MIPGSANNTQSIQQEPHKQPNNYMHYVEQRPKSGSAVGGNTGQSMFHQSDGSDIITRTAIRYTSPTQDSLSSSTSYGSKSGPYAPTAYTPNEPLPAGSQQGTAAAANYYLYDNIPSFSNANYQQGLTVGYDTGPASSLREWPGHMAGQAGSLPSQPEPQEYLNSATALMQLGGSNGQGGVGSIEATTDLSDGAAQQWPHLIFNRSQHSG